MELFPLCVNIEDKCFLVIGSGRVAQEKIDSMSRFSVRIVQRAEFFESDLDDADYVIGATSDSSINSRIYECCISRGIPVNIVDDAQKCTFVMPAMVKRGDLCVSITTGGKSPAYAARLRSQIEESLPDNIEDILDEMGRLRAVAKEKYSRQQERRAFFMRELDRLLS